MKLSRRHFARFALSRRLAGLVTLIGICASLFPLAISRPAAGEKDPSRPFPCQNRPCGCRSAEQCWKNCCCFTNAQKLAWARTHGVKPPAFVIAAAATEKSAKVRVAGGCEKCRQAAKSLPVAVARPTQKSHKSSNQVVVIALMQKCQGSSWFWNSLPWSTLVIPQELRLANPEPATWEPIASERPDEAELLPPVPPPRCPATSVFAG